jgi:nitroreductase
MRFTTILIAALLSVCASAPSQEAVPSAPALPKPRIEGGRPFLAVLKDRQSVRDFATTPISSQMIGDLLWAGYGVNRPGNGHRTAPSAMNSQEIDLYVVTAQGVSLYDATSHALKPVATGDLRPATGGQPFVKDAPLAIVLVADLPRMTKASPQDRERYAMFDAGCVSQNLYLFCASEGLGTVVHEVDRARLSQALKLRPDQRAILAHSVGYPKPAIDSPSR